MPNYIPKGILSVLHVRQHVQASSKVAYLSVKAGDICISGRFGKPTYKSAYYFASNTNIVSIS